MRYLYFNFHQIQAHDYELFQNKNNNSIDHERDLFEFIDFFMKLFHSNAVISLFWLCFYHILMLFNRRNFMLFAQEIR